MTPKADYFDELVDHNLLTKFWEAAKQLKITERDFIKYLIVKNYIYRNKIGKLMPCSDKNNDLLKSRKPLKK